MSETERDLTTTARRGSARSHAGFDTLSLTDSAARRIAEMIVSKRIRTGQRLSPERELAEELGISRGVLREALRTLESVGLVEARVGSGRYVTGLQPGDPAGGLSMWMQLQPVGEVVAVRRILEPAAIMAIPAARIEIAAAEVNAIQRRMEKAFNRGALEAAVYAHTEFHLSLVQYAPSRLHRALLASMVKAAEGAQLEILRTPRAGRESLEKHAAIQASLAAGDVANTAELVVAHLTPVFTYFPEAEKLGASDVEFMDI